MRGHLGGDVAGYAALVESVGAAVGVQWRRDEIDDIPGEITLNEELAEYRLIAPEKLKAWDYGTGLAVRDWLARRSE
mgnify:CR=1 FL=1